MSVEYQARTVYTCDRCKYQTIGEFSEDILPLTWCAAMFEGDTDAVGLPLRSDLCEKCCFELSKFLGQTV